MGKSKKEEVEYYVSATGKDFISALKSIGVDTSLENRKKIALENKVYNYIGSSNQNERLLVKLKAGRLKKA